VESENAKRKRKSAALAKERTRRKEEARCGSHQRNCSGPPREKEKSQKNYSLRKPKPKLNVGDRVRMFDGRSIGSIDTIEKNKAIVNYGVFTTQVNLELLELVEAAKPTK
jgi:DNA mismatch repair protein MutS2